MSDIEYIFYETYVECDYNYIERSILIKICPMTLVEMIPINNKITNKEQFLNAHK